MSLSCKGEDHSEIEIEFQKELNALSNEGKMFYHGGLKCIIKVKMGNLLLCVDRPERTSILQVGDHNGTFSTFGDIVVKLMDTAKKTTYHPAKNVGSTVYTRLLLENTMNLMGQICFLSVIEQIIFMLNAIHKTMPYKHATEKMCIMGCPSSFI